jgi:tight adherence protein B
MYTASVLIFIVASVLTSLALFRRPLRPQKSLQRRFSEALDPPGITEQPDVLALREAPGLSDRLEQMIAQHKWGASIKQLLLTAGSTKSVGSFARMSVGIGIVCGFLAYFLLPLPLLEVAAALVGTGLPSLQLMFKRSRRVAAFSNALPDAIELLARALRAGHSMNSSLEVVGEQSVEPLASEFLHAFQQQKCGIPIRDALLEMAERIPSKDLQFLITAILVQKETGGDLTEILDRTTHVIRERVRIEAEVRVYTAQGRLTGWILGLLPVFMLVFISVVNPGYSHVLFRDPLGQKLLYGSGISIMFGCFVISKIVDIKV